MTTQLLQDLNRIQEMLNRFRTRNNFSDVEEIKNLLEMKYTDFYYNEEKTFISFKEEGNNMVVSVLFKEGNWLITSVEFWMFGRLAE